MPGLLLEKLPQDSIYIDDDSRLYYPTYIYQRFLKMRPDLIICFSFPYRITPEICTLPTYGAINLHPAVLPAYRGPNVLRPFYDGADVLGATMHWMAEDFDTGNIPSQRSEPMH